MLYNTNVICNRGTTVFILQAVARCISIEDKAALKPFMLSYTFVFPKPRDWSRRVPAKRRAALSRMHALTVCVTIARRDIAIVGKIHLSRATRRDALQKGSERSGKEKRPARRGRPGARCRESVAPRLHATSRTISGSLTPPTVLSRWSFISRRQTGTGETERKNAEKKKRKNPTRNFESSRIPWRFMRCILLARKFVDRFEDLSRSHSWTFSVIREVWGFILRAIWESVLPDDTFCLLLYFLRFTW